MSVAGPFSTQAKAAEWLELNSADIALLDFALRDGTCAEIASQLSHEGVPIVVVSGYPREQAGSDFPDCLWLSKPISHENLIAALRHSRARQGMAGYENEAMPSI